MSRKIQFCLNDRIVSAEVEETEILSDTLRNHFGMIGLKEGCKTGDCGTCTVLLNGNAVRSCLILTCSIVHPIQQAFIDAGAVQCGFCIPGMVLTAKALLDRNHYPSEEEIRVALSGNLCRCTGYEKIVKAVLLASQRMYTK